MKVRDCGKGNTKSCKYCVCMCLCVMTDNQKQTEMEGAYVLEWMQLEKGQKSFCRHGEHNIVAKHNVAVNLYCDCKRCLFGVLPNTKISAWCTNKVTCTAVTAIMEVWSYRAASGALNADEPSVLWQHLQKLKVPFCVFQLHVEPVILTTII